ncbi:ribonuclease P protein subunit p30 isoform X2 [Leucoraja erinacea]|uniref:ribonuclease P protein subunit p30 isoform X2 n=1 Tax=Leucoraja erinaceus TaxID=7782 RepID=UPI0024550E50|nr:ribonuclease P protein subunit p30 isoform X2 [Leucoraja erinacea]
MVCFADLNIININDKKRLQTIIETAAHLGYSTVAINHVLDFQQKEQGIANPISVAELFPSPPIVQGKSKPIKIMTRLTLIASDVSHYNQLRTAYPQNLPYDIIAVEPKTEKLFHVACMTLDIDLICIQGNSKLPFRITRPPVNGAIARGIYFELTYFPAINDFTLRRYTISNGICLMNVCKGKNVIVSSATEEKMPKLLYQQTAELSFCMEMLPHPLSFSSIFVYLPKVACFVVMWKSTGIISDGLPDITLAT